MEHLNVVLVRVQYVFNNNTTIPLHCNYCLVSKPASLSPSHYYRLACLLHHYYRVVMFTKRIILPMKTQTYDTTPITTIVSISIIITMPSLNLKRSLCRIYHNGLFQCMRQSPQLQMSPPFTRIPHFFNIFLKRLDIHLFQICKWFIFLFLITKFLCANLPHFHEINLTVISTTTTTTTTPTNGENPPSSPSSALEGVYKAAISIGYNPCYKNEHKTIEPHLIAPPGHPSRSKSACQETQFHELYNETMRLSIVGYLRPELPFEGLDKLIVAIKKDIVDTEESLSLSSSLSLRKDDGDGDGDRDNPQHYVRVEAEKAWVLSNHGV
mmetsp:Transcript_7701/g.11541  ORF Transcript_7701/g.11541 Transcript_7701/m.11541 type:complete len:325 (+) Transcript_7701:18-992(+)